MTRRHDVFFFDIVGLCIYIYTQRLDIMQIKHDDFGEKRVRLSYRTSSTRRYAS